MANASDVSVGLAHELVIRLTNAGAEVIDISSLSRNEGLCRKVIELIRGNAEIVAVKLLESLGIVAITAATTSFVAKEKFVRDTSRNAKVKISYLGDNFKAWFLNGDGKTEDPESVQTLRYHKLRQSSVDGPIIAELGGRELAETTLSEMFSLMEKQGKGEDGVLLNNGYANIFYIKDSAGVLRAVYVGWGGGGWGVNARSVEGPGRWNAGCQVFSRNSDLKSSEPSAPAQA